MKAPWFPCPLGSNNDYLCSFKFHLLVINNFVILLQFHFSILFSYKKAFRVLGYSIILCLKIFYHSMLLNNLGYRVLQLTFFTNFDGSFWHKSLIQTVKCSLSKEKKLSFKFPGCADHIYREISARKLVI